MSTAAYPGPRSDRISAQRHRQAAQRNREAALARISRVRGLVIVGAGALTAAVAGVVSAVAPGRTLGAKEPARGSTPVGRVAKAAVPSTQARMPPLASPRQLGLQAPGSPPQSAPNSQPSAPSQPPAPTQQSAPAPQQPAPAPQQSAPAAPAQAPSSSAAVSGGS